MNQKHRFSIIKFAVLLLFCLTVFSAVSYAEDAPGTVAVRPERQLFDIINEARVKAKIDPLVWDNDLMMVAQIRVKELPVALSHTRPDGSKPQTAFKEAGVYFSVAGENYADSLTEAAEVYEKWLDSKASKSNMFRESFTHAAVGVFDVANTDGTVTRYWVMEFMKPKAAPDNTSAAPEGTVPITNGAASAGDIPDTDAVPAPGT